MAREDGEWFYFLVALGMALFYQFVSTLLTFPFTYYVGFVREHEYGLSTQDFAAWFTEYLQGAGIGLAIGSIGIALLYLIIRAAPRAPGGSGARCSPAPSPP